MDSNSSESLKKVAGSEAMAPPPKPSGAQASRPGPLQTTAEPSSRNNDSLRPPQSTENGIPKKKRHRGGRKRRNRRQSFVAPSESTAAEDMDDGDRRPSLLDGPRPSAARSSFYRLNSAARSNTSLESEALLDHRDHVPIRPRRHSNSQAMFSARPARNTPVRSSFTSVQASPPIRSRLQRNRDSISEDDEEDDDANDRTPLIGSSAARARPNISRNGSGLKNYGGQYERPRRRSSIASSKSRKGKGHHARAASDSDEFDVNNPPSVPGSPKIGSLDDVMAAEDFGRSPPGRDAVIDIDRHDHDRYESTPPSPREDDRRRRTVADLAQNDVCYPGDDHLSEIGEDVRGDETRSSPKRRRHRRWPDLDILEDWSREEKEIRDIEQIRAKKITEPVMVGGRLRPSKQAWHREEDDAPYRYTYFNESFDATIHSRTISELCQFGATYRDLFMPEAAELSDYSTDEDEDGPSSPMAAPSVLGPVEPGRGRPSYAEVQEEKEKEKRSATTSGSATPAQSHSQSHTPRQKTKRFGPRPTFWLDVLSPTEQEMKVLSKAFGIHQLTTEDIMMEEPREKVELFQNYYFVNYRSFEQDKDSEDYMEPVNIYVVVFRDGVLSFHFSMTPHPANVRRRIRQLNDYMSPSADWISYAVIDDVTDAYAPLVQQIEEDVDDIDDAILALHSRSPDDKPVKAKEFDDEKLGKSDARSEKPDGHENAGDMLRRVGECRKKVMSLYRLLGNKADVIKGFAKRCNEHWEVAPRSEIGLYLGDIQDHIVTMTGNLSHYENLLSRAHSNYLAQINIRMNQRAEQTNDVLGKLTVLGTIVLPMNIITGMWGMNCLVPGQDGDSLHWFWGITGGLIMFGLCSFLIAKRVYGIV